MRLRPREVILRIWYLKRFKLLAWARIPTFPSVDFEFHCLFEVFHASCHYSLSGSFGPDVDVAVVGISYEFMASAFEQFVKFRKV